MKKNLLYCCLLATMLSSCISSYYQVYEVKSDDAEIIDGKLCSDNKDFSIAYNMWREKGSLDFMMYNKTERNLYVVLTKSSFIRNGIAMDYYINKYESSARSKVLGEYWGLTSQYDVETRVVTIGQNQVVCVPPKSLKIISSFALNPEIMSQCDKKVFFPKDSSAVISYTEQDSPLKFRNRIAYSFDEDLSGISYVDNGFWVSSIRNYTRRSASYTEKVKAVGNNLPDRRRIFKMAAPNRFYMSYNDLYQMEQKTPSTRQADNEEHYIKIKRKR